MDFFCKDQNGNFVVIELKKEGKDTTIGQICRYMGWVKETLCKEGQEVSGMVISEVNDPYIQYSIRVLPKVTFKKMGFGVHPKKYTNS
jgi:RecB family endonuclease NucS